MSIKRQSVWSLLPLLVTAVVSFFTMPLFLRFLGNDMYALWGYIITFNGMFGFADILALLWSKTIGIDERSPKSDNGHEGNSAILPCNHPDQQTW